ncbi:MAG TPA: thioredoxin family protein [Castellaniella sp.]|uniref:thioredoxin family protein n=1 Tax=Castellaniella sp. TaxID=1955812 RepID=UPI002F221681
MKLFNPATDLDALRERLAQDGGLRVACYCAAWCRTCDAYRPALESLAARLPAWTFIWIDIEDSPEWLGDEDVEDFPTLLVQDRQGTRFWGTQLPHIEQLERLINGAGTLPVLHAGPGLLDRFASRT